MFLCCLPTFNASGCSSQLHIVCELVIVCSLCSWIIVSTAMLVVSVVIRLVIVDTVGTIIVLVRVLVR